MTVAQVFASADHSATKALGDAFDRVRMRLNGGCQLGFLNEVVASRICEIHRRTGDADAARLAHATLESFGLASQSP